MKLTYFALTLFLITGLLSCRKDTNDIDIKTYDDQQIQAYIKASGFNNMKKATDTSGIYYEILSQGTGDVINYPDLISYVYSVKSLDGQFSQPDTIVNHSYNYAGLVAPKGVMIAIHDLMKTKGTRAHIIVPSRMAYGSTGNGTGSTRLPGNVSLDYYINVIKDQATYDDIAIQKYISTNGLSGYTKILATDPKFGAYAGLYYKINQAGDGTTLISNTSTITCDYNLKLLNGTLLENGSLPSTDLNNSAAVVAGFRAGLLIAGSLKGNVSVIFPSRYGYKEAGSGSVPANACLYFDISVTGVTN
jgi:FKBP-type peptidyl-prolyl cis-trans isomerase FkpA